MPQNPKVSLRQDSINDFIPSGIADGSRWERLFNTRLKERLIESALPNSQREEVMTLFGLDGADGMAATVAWFALTVPLPTVADHPAAKFSQMKLLDGIVDIAESIALTFDVVDQRRCIGSPPVSNYEFLDLP